eukprot:CAMPEP_0198305540 /NCGR_PEP_ID=MMETSP1449-20131203/57956_1 /TAXON_ID=420275 /ORGANISM="Attheya septentrionalis, Strain CCMP2084" /LENGTH=273 /DNA_ID=CAMNT_0044008075 /DNA_START=164 /DNA_END=985 /DNA_ORIENTATION=-
MSKMERGTVFEPQQNIWSMYGGRGSESSNPTNTPSDANDMIPDVEHLGGRRVRHWNPRVIGFAGGFLCLTMVLVLSLGITLGGRAARDSKRELDIMDWHDACKYDQLAGKGWNRCLEQCELYVCCDFDGGCNPDRAPLCDRYENWCATVRVTANSRGIRPSITPIDDDPAGDYDEDYDEDYDYDEPTSAPVATEGLDPTFSPSVSGAPTNDPTTTLPPSVSVEPTNDPTTTLPPTLIPTTSSPPSRAPVVAPKITPSPSKTPVTEAPVNNFKM